MKGYFPGIVATAVALLVVSLGLSAAPKGDAAAGKEVFMKKCKICHGPDGEGNAGVAKAMNVKFTPLGSEEIQKKTDAELKKTITEGKGKMKPVKEISDADVENVIAFVRTLKK
jgi:mono/diheme cytochrome c family protein